MQAIYGIENIENGCLYVGSAVDYQARRRNHKCALNKLNHKNKKLQNSWNKHGEEKFYFHVIESVSDKHQLVIREQYWIDFYRTILGKDFLYNMNPLATSSIGLIMSESSRGRMSIAKLGVKRGPRPDYVKRKISESNKGKKIPRHIIEKTAAFNRGRNHSYEHKKKISTALKNREWTEQERYNRRMQISVAKRKLSNEKINKILNLRCDGAAFKKISLIIGCSAGTVENLFKKDTIAYGKRLADPMVSYDHKIKGE